MARRKRRPETKAPTKARKPWHYSDDPDERAILKEMKERLLELLPRLGEPSRNLGGRLPIDDPRTPLKIHTYDDPQLHQLQARRMQHHMEKRK